MENKGEKPVIVKVGERGVTVLFKQPSLAGMAALLRTEEQSHLPEVTQ